jgi:hypothetical protein
MPNRNWTSDEELLETHQWLGPLRPANGVPRLAGCLPHPAAVSLTPAYAASLMAIDRIGQAEGHGPKEGYERWRLKVAFGGKRK